MQLDGGPQLDGQARGVAALETKAVGSWSAVTTFKWTCVFAVMPIKVGIVVSALLDWEWVTSSS